MVCLELFSGSGTVSNIARSAGHFAWSVDINPKFKPSICCDILNLNQELLPKQIDFIWASPDCRCFSRNGFSGRWLKINIGYRRYQYIPITDESRKAVALVEKTIEIIQHYTPKVWFIENPVGRLRHLDCMKYFAPYRYSVNYKDYGFEYSKETDIYTNILLPLSIKKQVRPGLSVSSVNSRYRRSLVPEQLIYFLLKQGGILL